MNATVSDSLAAQLPTLSRVVDAPVGTLAFGVDLSCVTDLDPELREVDPESPSAIVEAVIRRYLTPRGGLLDDPDYGLDVRTHLNRGVTQRDLRAISGALRGEAQKDDRVSAADVTITATLRSSTAQIEVQITPTDPALSDFDFTFAVDSADALKVTVLDG